MKLPKYLKVPKLRAPLIIRKIQGHSMMPVLPPSTTVLGWSWYVKIVVGDVVIFRHENKEKIKRIEKIKDNKLFLVGDYPEASTDSRDFGWIKKSEVTARVFWPHAPKSRAEKN